MSETRTKPKCQGGTPCGDTCIAKGKNCLDDLDGPAKDLAVKLISIVSGEAKRDKGGGAGSASLNETEVTKLLENKDFLLNATPAEIVARAKERGLAELAEDGGGVWTDADLDKVTDAVWQALPTKTKTHLKNKGSLAKGNYFNPETGEHEGPNEPRARLLLKRFIEQNGRDAYTGEPISLTGSDLEHIEPFGVYGKDAERADNFAFVSVSVNQRKAEKTFKQFFDEQVEPIADAASKDPEYWSKQGAKAAEAQAKRNAVDELLKEKSKDSWTDDDIESLGSKYYYAARSMGHLLSYEKTRPRGVSGQTFSVAMGKPLAKAFAKAYREGDQARIDALEAARKQIVEAAKAESKEKKGNAGAKGGLMYNEYERLRSELGW